jgi:hypothetical protein
VPHISLVFREMWEMRTLTFFASGVEDWPVERSGIPHLAKDERDMGHPLSGTKRSPNKTRFISRRSAAPVDDFTESRTRGHVCGSAAGNPGTLGMTKVSVVATSLRELRSPATPASGRVRARRPRQSPIETACARDPKTVEGWVKINEVNALVFDVFAQDLHVIPVEEVIGHFSLKIRPELFTLRQYCFYSDGEPCATAISDCRSWFHWPSVY